MHHGKWNHEKRKTYATPTISEKQIAAMRDALKKSRDYFAALREVVAGCPSEKNLSLRIKEIDAALSGDL